MQQQNPRLAQAEFRRVICMLYPCLIKLILRKTLLPTWLESCCWHILKWLGQYNQLLSSMDRADISPSLIPFIERPAHGIKHFFLLLLEFF